MAEVKVVLPDAPGPRKNSKPRKRYGTLKPSPWRMPGYLFVEKDDGKCWWVPEGICEVIQCERL